MCVCIYWTNESGSHEDALKGGFKILHYWAINMDSYTHTLIRRINSISLIIETGNRT